MSDTVGQTRWPVRLDYSCPPTLLVCFFGLPCIATRTCGNTEHRGVADIPAHVHVHFHVATGSSHAPDSGDRVDVRAKRIKRFTAARRIPQTPRRSALGRGHVELAECSPGRGSIPGARLQPCPSHAAKHTSCQARLLRGQTRRVRGEFVGGLDKLARGGAPIGQIAFPGFPDAS